MKKFFVDRMLGKLAKKLRMLGFDTIFFPEITEEEFLYLAKKDDERIILTKDKKVFEILLKEGKKVLFVKSDKWRSQLRFVYNALKLNEEKNEPFSICPICNEKLEEVEKKEVINLVPEYVFKTVEEFRRCPKCGRVYWKGSHIDRFNDELRKILGVKK